MYKAKERLYLTADRARLVREGGPEGAVLYAAPGDEIPDSAVEMFGLAEDAASDTPVLDAAAAEAAAADAAAADAAAADAAEAAAKEAAAAADKEAKGAKATKAAKAKG